MQTRSRSVRRCASPMKKPLLRMLWWVSVAPLGAPVVPLVNWMLIGVVELQLRRQLGELARWRSPPARPMASTSSKRKKPAPRRRRCGSASSAPAARSACSAPGTLPSISGASSRSMPT